MFFRENILAICFYIKPTSHSPIKFIISNGIWVMQKENKILKFSSSPKSVTLITYPISRNCYYEISRSVLAANTLKRCMQPMETAGAVGPPPKSLSRFILSITALKTFSADFHQIFFFREIIYRHARPHSRAREIFRGIFMTS